jgi:uncharacterized protein (TIGR02246 family)
METETRQIHRTIQELQAGWLVGSGAQFAAAFAPQGRFVAFDGTTLTGPSEIANFHQRAFDNNPDKRLRLSVSGSDNERCSDANTEEKSRIL